VGSLSGEYLKRLGLFRAEDDNQQRERILFAPGFRNFDPHPGFSKMGSKAGAWA
jgi:hypothetical protein